MGRPDRALNAAGRLGVLGLAGLLERATLLVTNDTAPLGKTPVRPESGARSRPNVLFLIVDDMNDWVGCLEGHPDAHTPNIDRLASRGVLFTNAHCVSPICGPSRAAVLTGQRPETTGVYHNRGNYRDYVPAAITFPWPRIQPLACEGGGCFVWQSSHHEPL